MRELARPLNEIPAAATVEVVRRVLRRTTPAVPVEVARFGSAI